ncbi:hypothetical protein Lal_00015554 [Lupinus albus]|nr:hypothetical protein Lal_00015554 [Lupinus albus]
MTSMQVGNFHLTSHHQHQIIKNLIINNQFMNFLVMSLDKELHEMVVGMTNEDYTPPRHSNMWDVISYMGILALLLN